MPQGAQREVGAAAEHGCCCECGGGAAARGGRATDERAWYEGESTHARTPIAPGPQAPKPTTILASTSAAWHRGALAAAAVRPQRTLLAAAARAAAANGPRAAASDSSSMSMQDAQQPVAPAARPKASWLLPHAAASAPERTPQQQQPRVRTHMHAHRSSSSPARPPWARAAWAWGWRWPSAARWSARTACRSTGAWMLGRTRRVEHRTRPTSTCAPRYAHAHARAARTLAHPRACRRPAPPRPALPTRTTPQLPVAQRRGVPHHLIDVLDVEEEFSAGRFHDDARAAMRGIVGVSAGSAAAAVPLATTPPTRTCRPFGHHQRAPWRLASHGAHPHTYFPRPGACVRRTHPPRPNTYVRCSAAARPWWWAAPASTCA